MYMYVVATILLLVAGAYLCSLSAQSSSGAVDPVQALEAVISIPLSRDDAYIVVDQESIRRVAGLDSAQVARLTDRLGYRGTVGIPAEDEICRLTTKQCIAVVLDSYRRAGNDLQIETSTFLVKNPDACEVR